MPGLEGRLTHVLPDDQSFTLDRHPLVAVAPDGSSIVYVANNRLFLRPIDELEARPIRGTEGPVSTPFFSPDGRSVGYWDSGDEGLKRIDIGGGTPIVLDRATIIRGASWAPDGTILYAKSDGIWTVRAEGGQPKLVIPIEQGLGPRTPDAARRAQRPVHTTPCSNGTQLGRGGACRSESRKRTAEGPGDR